MNPNDFRIATIVSELFQQNSYVIHFAGNAECIVSDPGLEPEAVLEYLDGHQLTPAAVLLSHGHSDHIAGNGEIKRRWPKCPLVIGARDAPKLTNARLNLSLAFGMSLISPPADREVHEGDVVAAAGFDWHVLDVPGHTCGHVMYLWKDHQPQVALVGDVIFAGSIGRTDFPDGDFEQLVAGIRNKVYTLPDDTLLYAGHGPPTTVGEEKRANPFVQSG